MFYIIRSILLINAINENIVQDYTIFLIWSNNRAVISNDGNIIVKHRLT